MGERTGQACTAKGEFLMLAETFWCQTGMRVRDVTKFTSDLAMPF